MSVNVCAGRRCVPHISASYLIAVGCLLFITHSPKKRRNSHRLWPHIWSDVYAHSDERNVGRSASWRMTPSECCRLDWQILQAPSRLADRYSVTVCLCVQNTSYSTSTAQRHSSLRNVNLCSTRQSLCEKLGRYRSAQPHCLKIALN